jgi:hypothetical protein
VLAPTLFVPHAIFRRLPPPPPPHTHTHFLSVSSLFFRYVTRRNELLERVGNTSGGITQAGEVTALNATAQPFVPTAPTATACDSTEGSLPCDTNDTSEDHRGAAAANLLQDLASVMPSANAGSLAALAAAFADAVVASANDNDDEGDADEEEEGEPEAIEVVSPVPDDVEVEQITPMSRQRDSREVFFFDSANRGEAEVGNTTSSSVKRGLSVVIEAAV